MTWTLCNSIAPEWYNGMSSSGFDLGLPRIGTSKRDTAAASFPIMSQFTVVGDHGALRMERLDAVHRLVGSPPAPCMVDEQIRYPLRLEIACVERVADMEDRIISHMYLNRHDIALQKTVVVCLIRVDCDILDRVAAFATRESTEPAFHIQTRPVVVVDTTGH